MTFIEELNSYFDFVDKIDHVTLFYAIIGFMTVMFVWENYLAFRQVSHFILLIYFFSFRNSYDLKLIFKI